MKKIFLPLLILALASCRQTQEASSPQLLDHTAFDTVLNDKQVGLYTITNDAGMVVELTNYGARIVSVWVPAADGSFIDVSHGYESIDAYLAATDNNSGPVMGRFGNRIDKGRFTIDGTEYQVEINDGENHLHGGDTGFAHQVWDATVATTEKGHPAVEMWYRAADGEGGYPGNLDITVRYSLEAGNRLVIEYTATTDAPTILNPTVHPYFNLHGTASKSTNSHVMMIDADSFTATDSGLIPTAELVSVEGTPLDFRTPRVIGERIDSDYEAIVLGLGYDHNFVLNKSGAGGAELAARVYEPETGVVLNVYTDQPGMQFYSGNFMDGTNTGKRGQVYNYRTGIALETQNFPDAPNHDNFPSAVLRPGEVYTQICVYEFLVEK